MERVAFLIEDSGERVSCLLNPESVVLRRRSGVKTRESSGGLVAGSELRDDPLLLTGGGSTELTLNLLFDVSLGGSSIQTQDVRDLTGPLWRLTENVQPNGEFGRPALVRFFWGKSWNIPGIIESIAERLEYFTSEGAPRRSWLRLRMLRSIPPSTARGWQEISHPGAFVAGAAGGALTGSEANRLEVHRVTAVEGTMQSERLDQLAQYYYGSAALWRIIAAFNGLDDIFGLSPGARLEIPPLHHREDQP